ncbi:hypothetical protein ACTQZS_10040, partial [Bilifractor sp. LCP19S3_H10]
LIKMGVPEDLAWQAGNSRRGHWFTTHTVAVNMAMTKERLINSGFYDLATAYQSVHVISTIEGAVYRTVRTVL